MSNPQESIEQEFFKALQHQHFVNFCKTINDLDEKSLREVLMQLFQQHQELFANYQWAVGQLQKMQDKLHELTAESIGFSEYHQYKSKPQIPQEEQIDDQF